MFLSAVSPTFSLVLDARDKPEGLVEKAGSVCEEYEDNEGVQWVNVSESSGAGSAGLSLINGQLLLLLGIRR